MYITLKKAAVMVVTAYLCLGGPLGGCGDDSSGGNNQDGNENNNNLVPGECGDGVVNLGEECDQGSSNSDSLRDTCRTDCRNPYCGDSVADSNESCDDGNVDETDDCMNDCTLPACGDGVVSGAEECDDGADNSDVYSDHCRTSCVPPRCGDGVYDPVAGEECDDGNTVDETDACNNLCEINHAFQLYQDTKVFEGPEVAGAPGGDFGISLLQKEQGLNPWQVVIFGFSAPGSWTHQVVPAAEQGSDAGLFAMDVLGADEFLVGSDIDRATPLPGLRDIVATSYTYDGSVISAVSTESFSNFLTFQDVAVGHGRTVFVQAFNPNIGPPVLRLVFDDGSPTVEITGNIEGAPATDRPPVRAQIVVVPSGYLVVWSVAVFGTPMDPDDGEIWGVYLDTDGTPDVAGELQLNTTNAYWNDNFNRGGPRLAALPDGTTLVVWTADDSINTNVRGRILDPGGSFAGAEFDVNLVDGNPADHPDVAVTPDGGFVVSWRVNEAAGVYSVRARYVSAAGVPEPTDFFVGNAVSLDNTVPRVASTVRGELIAWYTWLPNAHELRATLFPRPILP